MIIRYCLTIAAIASLVGRLSAQAPPPTISLKLVPAAEPVPSLKYRLLPELRDQTAGNAALLYYRAFSPEWQQYRREVNWADTLDKARETPLKDLPRKELAWVRDLKVLREVDRAARRPYCDWELKERAREDGIALSLPDLQALRQFAPLLAVRARLEMADGKFNEAARTFETMYALARHTGEGPTLIHGLVGIAIAAIANKELETWVQTPGSPNLYWALTDLPTSFIDLRTPLQGERFFVDNIMPNLREQLHDPSLPPMSVEQMRQALRKISEAADHNPNEDQWIGIAFGIARYPGAKKFLAEHGWTAAQIEAMPTLQAVCMQELFEYERFYDLMARGAHLPFAQGRAIMQEAENELKKAISVSPLHTPIMAKLLLPAMTRLFWSRARLDRQIAALRAIEAIRLHAAANGGKLPESLAAITAVPMPLDPVFNKPFDYVNQGDKATLSAEPPPGERPHAGNVVRYEITIAK